ncbi:MAG: phosphopentomutase [Eubacteriaceae bacterium]|nr:phosphopentomutase [Eubacteriaceae bacterium]
MGIVALIVIDSVGIGELPDAQCYGDEGSNTLGNIYKLTPGFSLNNMQRLGLAHIDGVDYAPKQGEPIGAYGRMAPLSEGKDSTTGHWEIAGHIVNTPFATFPDGFGDEIISEFIAQTGYGVLCNKPYSGTEVIKDFGEEHLKTGKLIVYTSADSVFQIAANTSIVPLEELYRVCQKARGFLDQYNVSRVIARPFIGDSPESFTRTADRKDFSMLPSEKTLLDFLVESGKSVLSIGKISELFAGRGISTSIQSKSNAQGIAETIKAIHSKEHDLAFVNLVDFDQLYGHRNDIAGYANALIEFDNSLPSIMKQLGDDDILIITADHGNDPSTPSTDHSREYVPLLVYKNGIKSVNLGTRASFADIAATIAEFWGLGFKSKGQSFLGEII